MIELINFKEIVRTIEMEVIVTVMLVIIIMVILF
jgi:hypothetical protein